MDVQKKDLLLFNTFAKGDASISDGKLLLPGFSARLNDIVKVQVVSPRTEVVQTVVIGASDPTLVASEVYKISIKIPEKRDQGWRRMDKNYRAVAPADVSNQATARAALYADFVAQINADVEFPVTASINGDDDLEISDNAGYYLNGRAGASNIRVVRNDKGLGFVDADLVVTQEPVYSAGIGTDLANKKVGVDPLIGNAYTGMLGNAALDDVDASATYVTAAITSLVQGNGVGTESEHRVLKMYESIILVKVGAAGADEFYQVLTEATFAKTASDGIVAVLSGYKPSQTTAIDGGVAVVTTNISNLVTAGKHILYSTNVGAQASAANATLKNDLGVGFNLASAETANIGRELNTGLDADQPGLIVGKHGASVHFRGNIATVTAGAISIGFRTKGNPAADITSYDDYAAVGNIGGGVNVDLSANVAGGTAYTPDSGIDVADATDFELNISLNIDGTVKALVAGQVFTLESADGTPMVFTEGDEVVPFLHHINIGGATATPIVKQFVASSFDAGRTIGGILTD